jgi:hypothetical protein
MQRNPLLRRDLGPAADHGQRGQHERTVTQKLAKHSQKLAKHSRMDHMLGQLALRRISSTVTVGSKDGSVTVGAGTVGLRPSTRRAPRKLEAQGPPAGCDSCREVASELSGRTRHGQRPEARGRLRGSGPCQHREGQSGHLGAGWNDPAGAGPAMSLAQGLTKVQGKTAVRHTSTKLAKPKKPNAANQVLATVWRGDKEDADTKTIRDSATLSRNCCTRMPRSSSWCKRAELAPRRADRHRCRAQGRRQWPTNI